jgi:hypothetical protein
MDVNEESDDNLSNQVVMSPQAAKPKKSKTVNLKKFNVFKKSGEASNAPQQQATTNIPMLELNEQQLLLLQQQQAQGLLQQTTFGNYDNNNHDDIVILRAGKGRDEWTNKIEYLLSVIGYVVDLGNCIRFPYICYKNGGGAFLIPYFIFLFLIGIPMMYMEMSVGQFFRVGNITLWGKVNIFMKGNVQTFFFNIDQIREVTSFLFYI